MSDFTDLQVWKKSHTLALDVYRITTHLPRSEIYGLQSQMRRSAVSVVANLAEGSGRSTNKDFARFVGIAIGSVSELDYQLLIAKDLGYLDEAAAENARDCAVEVRRMLSSVRNHLVGGER